MPPCLHCGNNPTPHFMAWLTESLNVCFTPLSERLYGTRIGRALDWLADRMLWGMVRILQKLKVARFHSDQTRVPNERARVLWEEAERRGIKMEGMIIGQRPSDLYRVELGNRTLLFNGLPRPRQTPAMLWMDDKARLRRVLETAGVSVPPGGCFTSWRDARTCFEQLEKPVVVKPRLGSRGRHTTTFVFSEDHLRHAFEVAQQLCHWVIVEEHLEGSVYRGTVIGGELVGVLGGDPPRVTGDGIHTIAEFISLKNAARHSRVAEVIITPSLEFFLARQGLSLDTVLPAGRTIDLSEKIGIGYGGTSFEITDATHPDTKQILEQAAAVVGDSLLGFDFIIADITRSPREQKWGIIECNGTPFINLHHDPLYGEPNNVAKYVWDMVV